MSKSIASWLIFLIAFNDSYQFSVKEIDIFNDTGVLYFESGPEVPPNTLCPVDIKLGRNKPKTFYTTPNGHLRVPGLVPGETNSVKYHDCPKESNDTFKYKHFIAPLSKINAKCTTSHNEVVVTYDIPVGKVYHVEGTITPAHGQYHKKLVNKRANTMSFTHLKPGHKYKVTLRASAGHKHLDKNYSEPTELICITTASEPTIDDQDNVTESGVTPKVGEKIESSPILNNNHGDWVAIIVGVYLILLIMVIKLLMKCYSDYLARSVFGSSEANRDESTQRMLDPSQQGTHVR